MTIRNPYSYIRYFTKTQVLLVLVLRCHGSRTTLHVVKITAVPDIGRSCVQIPGIVD